MTFRDLEDTTTGSIRDRLRDLYRDVADDNVDPETAEILNGILDSEIDLLRLERGVPSDKGTS